MKKVCVCLVTAPRVVSTTGYSSYPLKVSLTGTMSSPILTSYLLETRGGKQ